MYKQTKRRSAESGVEFALSGGIGGCREGGNNFILLLCYLLKPGKISKLFLKAKTSLRGFQEKLQTIESSAGAGRTRRITAPTHGCRCKIVENTAGVTGAGPHAAKEPQLRVLLCGVSHRCRCVTSRRNNTFIG
jgi:hypothetical protein